MTLVADTSVVIAALIDRGPHGAWAEKILAGDDLAAPHLMPVEAANVLRITALAGRISQDIATLAHADLFRIPIELYPYEVLGSRIWELRATVTPYDAWYVALAEALSAPLATLDDKLVRAPGPRCKFTTFGQS